jgi:hypothetical protein
MPDDLTATLESALGAEADDRGPDLAWVIQHGKRKRLVRAMGMALMAVALVAVATSTIAVLEFPSGTQDDLSVSAPELQLPRRGEVVEEISEKQRAEIFAFRAVASTGLMSLRGRAYLYTYEDDTTQTNGGWSVGFTASECDPTTCRGLSGENASGNRAADTSVIVGLEDEAWTVVDVQGRMSAAEEARIVRFSLPARSEPSHWEFHAITTGGHDEGFSVQMFPLWIGPYPTTALGSVCEMQPRDDEGRPAGDATEFYLEAPTRELERAGGIQIRGMTADDSAVTASVDCRQYTGRVWEVVSEPLLVEQDGRVVGVSADLQWRGDEGFTTPARCRASLVRDGEVVFEGSGRVEELWRDGELRDYPYKTTAVVTTRGEMIRADAVGDFVCESL